MVTSARVATRPRRGNWDADIDESLFGATRASQTITNKTQRPSPSAKATKTPKSKGGTSVVQASMMARLGLAPAADSAVLGASELAAIERLANPRPVRSTSPVQIAASLALANKPLPELPPSEEDLLEQEARLATLRAAKAALDEDHDEVKHMNQLMLYAQCVTIRDAQVSEKDARVRQLKQREQALDAAMEAERAKQLRLAHEREEAKEQERRAGAATIIDQIHAREVDRIRAEDAREAEARAMVEQIRKLAEAEESKRKDRVEKGRQLMESIAASNHDATAEKHRRREKEAEEERKRLAYLQAKETRERAAEEEAQRIRAEKECEVARLRALQERAQDRQSQVDEIRAKRYQQEKDRQHRESILAKEKERIRSLKEIEAIRSAQVGAKEEKEQIEREYNKKELEIIQRIQARDAEREQRAKEAKEEERRKHALKLAHQIEEAHAAKAQARAAYIAEAAEAARREAEERDRLERIRAEKVEALERMGVPEKYAAALKKKKIMEEKITKQNWHAAGTAASADKTSKAK